MGVLFHCFTEDSEGKVSYSSCRAGIVSIPVTGGEEDSYEYRGLFFLIIFLEQLLASFTGLEPVLLCS